MLSSKQMAALFSSTTSTQAQCRLLQVTAKATICHKSKLKPKNVYHWPYERRPWNALTMWADPFTKRKFDENSKIIVVDGNIGAGKDDLARRLADELGMKYAPPIDLERHFYTDYGFDYRALNPQLPERMRACDMKMWHENPARHSAIFMQDIIFKLRLAQYIRAMQHLLNTGQGVVLNRSVFTERVLIEAQHNLGWLPMGYLRGDNLRFYDWRLRYNWVRERVLTWIHKPHLVIYLDVPVEKCLENIKKRADPLEANSKALIPEYLEEIAQAYDDVMLPKMDYNGHVLRYQRNERMTDDDLSDVIDDIEELDFTFDWHDTRFTDWDEKSEKFYHRNARKFYTSKKVLGVFPCLCQNWYDIAGMGDSITAVDLKMKNVLYEAHTAGVGYHDDYDTDIQQSGLIKSVLDLPNFSRLFDLMVRTDYY